MAQLREDVRAYEEKAHQDEDALREGKQQLVEIREEFESFKLRECSRVASLKMEVEAIRQVQEESRRAKEAVIAELANTRDALLLERERVVSLQREKEAACHTLQAFRSEKENTEAIVARLYVDIRVSQDNAKEAVSLLQCVKNDLADERRRVVALEQEIHAVRKSWEGSRGMP